MNTRQFLPFLPVLLLALLAVGSLSGCGENAFTKQTREHQEQYATIDDDTIRSYLRQHNYPTYTRTDDGVYIVPLVKGSGPADTTGKQVRVKYIGRILSINSAYSYLTTGPIPGNVFDNSTDNRTACGCAVFTVGSGLVAGFSEGLTYMRQGDRSLLLLPSQQAYGPNGNVSGGGYSIYPDSALLFDVELLEVSQ